MKKSFITKFLPFVLLIFISKAHITAATEDAVDLSHLPKKLQSPAKAFYDTVEDYYRHAVGAERDEDGAAAAAAAGGDRAKRAEGTSFYDHYAAGDSVLSEPVMAFVDWMIFSEGIGAKKSGAIAGLIRARMHNFINPAFVLAGDSRQPAKAVEFLARLEHLGTNPYAQYLRGILIYFGVGEAPDQPAGHELILDAARGNYIGALRFLNAIRPFDDRDEEQKSLKWTLEDLPEPEKFIIDFLGVRGSSLDAVDGGTFERLENTVLNCCLGDNDKLWAIYQSLTPMMFRFFKGLQSPLGDLEKGHAQGVVISGTALGLSIAWVIAEPGLEPVLSTTMSAIALTNSSVSLVRNGSFYRGMSHLMCCCSESFREWAPMDLEDAVINTEARLASLLVVIRFADKFQGIRFETAESAAHKIRLAIGTPALAGTGSLAKRVLDEEDVLT
jgi:hypothetical protein